MYRLLSEGMTGIYGTGNGFCRGGRKNQDSSSAESTGRGSDQAWLELHVREAGMTQAQLEADSEKLSSGGCRLKTGEFLQLGDAGILQLPNDKRHVSREGGRGIRHLPGSHVPGSVSGQCTKT